MAKIDLSGPAALLFLLTLLLASLLPAGAIASNPSEKSPPKVLLLNSYHHSYTWSDRELGGIVDVFENSGLKPDLYVEFMDSKRFPNNEHFEQLRALFAVKYAKNRPDLIMTLDNPAFEFAIKYRQKLFKGVPVVFAGLNDYEPALLKGETAITGIVEKQDMAGTVRLARNIHPELKEVVILHDFTASGLASRKEAEEQFAAFGSTISFRYLPDMTIEEVISTLKTLKPGSILLPFSYSRDSAGHLFTHAELTTILAKNSPVPVYGTKEERLGYGIIGGSLLEGKSHGALGGRLAVRILQGEQADSIPVVTEPESRLVFDYIQLKKFRVNPDMLPAGSEIINRTPGIYSQHALVINVAAGIILLLSCSLALVIIANRKRSRAEEALVASERSKTRVLEAANSEMESFCYAVSHDLQAPLRHIHSFSSIIEEDYGNCLDKQGLNYLARLKAASARMGDLISDLLLLSRVSRSELNRTSFDLGKFAAEVLDELFMHEPARELAISMDEEMKVFADRKLLRVVLDNLIGNAWKYTSKTPAGAIHLGVQTAADGRTIHFIQDNGAGFDMQYAEKLFAPFQRLHSEHEFEGNGIGLATVQRIISRHGGQIWAESKPGEGATFYFTLQP